MDVFNNFRPAVNSLNLVFKVKQPIKANAAGLREVLKYLAADNFNEVVTVSFIFLEDDSKLLVSTTYDGDLNDYLDKVIHDSGDIFNSLLTYVQAPDNIIPIQQNRPAFIDYIAALNVIDQDFHSVDPELRVADIIKDKPEYVED